MACVEDAARKVVWNVGVQAQNADRKDEEKIKLCAANRAVAAMFPTLPDDAVFELVRHIPRHRLAATRAVCWDWKRCAEEELRSEYEERLCALLANMQISRRCANGAVRMRDLIAMSAEDAPPDKRRLLCASCGQEHFGGVLKCVRCEERQHNASATLRPTSGPLVLAWTFAVCYAGLRQLY